MKFCRIVSTVCEFENHGGKHEENISYGVVFVEDEIEREGMKQRERENGRKERKKGEIEGEREGGDGGHIVMNVSLH